jgi:effector-binding domain-containing protein
MIAVQQQSAIPLATIHRRAGPADLPRLVPELCGRVWSALQRQGVGSGRHLAVYWDDAGRVFVSAKVFGSFREDDELVATTTPPGEVASTVHFGPYAGLGAAHAAIRSWCEMNGRRIAGPRWELCGHWVASWNAHPERIRTDVCYLLEPGSRATA